MAQGNKLKLIKLERTTGTKDLNVDIIADVELLDILNNFTENIKRIKEKFNIVDELADRDMEEAYKDILRSQIVLLMSSVDFYIHEVVKYGILKIFKKEKKKTKEYKLVIVSIECVEKALENPESVDWLEENIVLQNKFKSFMAINKIRNALKIISDKKILDNSIKKVAKDIKKSEDEVKDILNRMYKRRNCIAHQTDRDPIKCTINDISKEEVKEGLDVINKLILSIHDEIKNDV